MEKAGASCRIAAERESPKEKQTSKNSIIPGAGGLASQGKERIRRRFLLKKRCLNSVFSEERACWEEDAKGHCAKIYDETAAHKTSVQGRRDM